MYSGIKYWLPSFLQLDRGEAFSGKFSTIQKDKQIRQPGRRGGLF